MLTAEDRDRIAARQVAAEVARTVADGRVVVVRADSLAGESSMPWAAWPGVVTWRAWPRPAAERRGVAVTWDGVTSSPERIASSGPQLSLLWREACAAEPLPELLSIAGAPADNSGTLISAWIDALAGAIRRSATGLTVITNAGAPAWALARCLPGYVGER